MEALSKDVPVAIITRPRSAGRLGRFRLRTERINKNLIVVYGGYSLTDAPKLRSLRPFLVRLDVWRLRRCLRSKGYRRPIYWLGVNNSTYAQRHMGPWMVYDCIDPCFRLDIASRHDAEETAILRIADLVFATALTLEERMRLRHNCVYLLPNAYAPSAGPAPARPVERGPIGFMGVIDERLDWGFLGRCAIACPNVEILLVGRINPSQKNMARNLQKMYPNVRFTGEVDLNEGVRLSAAFAVGLIPFQAGGHGDSINPVKLYMYLGAGTPVVGTPTRELTQVGAPLVYVCQAGTEQTCLEAALDEGPNDLNRHARRVFALQNSWSHRAETAVGALRREGLLR